MARRNRTDFLSGFSEKLYEQLLRGRSDLPFDEEVLDEPDDDFPEDFSSPYLFNAAFLSRAAQVRLQQLHNKTRSPAQVEKLLGPLSGEGLLLLRFLAEVGRFIPLAFVTEEARLLLGAKLGPQAHAELQDHDLLVTENAYGTHSVGLPQEIAARLLPLLPPLEEPASRPEPEEHHVPPHWSRVPFELALLALAIGTLRPRCTQAGPLYKRDEDRLHGVLGSAFPLKQRMQELRDLRLCSGYDPVSVPPRAMERLKQLTLREVVRRFSAPLFYGARQKVLELLQGGTTRGPEASWFPRAALERAMRIGFLQGPTYFQQHAALARSAHGEVDEILGFASVEVQTNGRSIYTRLWPALYQKQTAAEPQHRARIHLQPSFEILVPQETPPAVLMELGQVADLHKADQMVALQVTRASVTRAIEGGRAAEELLKILEDHCFTAVPQNVAMSIRTWAKQTGQARFAEGLVLVLAPETEQIAQADPTLRRMLKQRVGAGVYLVDTRERGTIDKRLRALEQLPSEGVLRLAPEPDEPEEPIGRPGRQTVPPPAAQDGPLWKRVQETRARLGGGEQDQRS